MKPATAPSALRVQAFLGDAFDVVEFDAGTRTAQAAADAIGCSVAQIVKSLVFRTETTGRAVLALTSGVNRVDEARVAALVGEPVGRADPQFVRDVTGFAIGGVPPVAHANPSVVLVDESLLSLDDIWAAAGTPNAVFRLTPDLLVSLTGATVASFAAA